MGRRGAARNIGIGLTVIAAIGIFMVAILVVGQETRLFVEKVTYRTNFPDASGLRVGSPVTMAGVRVGTVSRILLPTDPGSEGIEVFVRVDHAYAQRVRKGTTASLVMLQFVANEKSVELKPGDPSEAEIPDGGFVPSDVPMAILAQGRSIANTLEQITRDISEILRAMRDGEGLLGKAIVDPEFGQEGLETLQKAFEAARNLLERINRGEGLIGKFVADEAFSTQVAGDLRRATSGLAAVAERIEKGEGLIGRLSTGDEGEALLEDLRRLSRAMVGVAETLEKGEGLAGKLLTDKEMAERFATNLDETMAHIASITRKIDEGQGSLGLLVNDPSLHENIQETITGVRSSKLASWLLRHYHRKGEKEAKKAGDAKEAGEAELPREKKVGTALPRREGRGVQAAGALGGAATYWTASGLVRKHQS